MLLLVMVVRVVVVGLPTRAAGSSNLWALREHIIHVPRGHRTPHAAAHGFALL